MSRKWKDRLEWALIFLVVALLIVVTTSIPESVARSRRVVETITVKEHGVHHVPSDLVGYNYPYVLTKDGERLFIAESLLRAERPAKPSEILVVGGTYRVVIAGTRTRRRNWDGRKITEIFPPL